MMIAEVLNLMIVFPVVTAALGLWVLVTGRPLNRWPGWPLGAKLRLWAACDLAASVAVIGLAVTGNNGLAFVTYALSALVLALGAVLATRRDEGESSPS